MGAIVAGALEVVNVFLGVLGNNKQDAANKKAARKAARVANRDISFRALQEKIAAAQEQAQLAQDVQEAQSLTSVSAAGGNVGGMTVDMLLQDVENTGLGAADNIAQQLKANLDLLNRERSGVLATTRSRMNETSAINPFNAGLRIAGAGVNAYTRVRSMDPHIRPGE